ncbi:MAG: hypothetical protein OEY59_02415 [Deltaproteobacteria bacterium]|nr:hypothetical protein [Deltaproteobacteria bacterium]
MKQKANLNKRFILTPLIFIVALFIMGQSSGLLIIEGTLVTRGNTPKHYLTLTDKDNQTYRLNAADSSADLYQYLGQEVRLSGKVVSKALGPGFPALFEVHEVIR